MNEQLQKYINDWYVQYHTTTEGQLYFQFHITNTCEGRCQHCYFNELPADQQVFVDFELIKRTIDQIVQYSRELGLKPTIDFTGGDPLLHPKIDEVLLYAHDKGASIGLKCCSNKINDKTVHLFKLANIERVCLSLEGMKTFNDMMRGKGDFDRTVNALSLLKKEGFYVRIKMTISKLNKHQVAPLMLFLINNDFQIDSFMWARYWTKENTKLCVSKMEYEQLIKQQFELLDDLYNSPQFYVTRNNKQIPKLFYDFKEHLWYPFLVEKGCIYKENKETFEKKRYSTGCTIAKNVYVIDFNGDVLKCRKMDSSLIGNIKNSGIPQIVEGPLHEAFVRRITDNMCSQCNYFNSCGGCRAMSEAILGDELAIDPCCGDSLYREA
ncbi:MAG: radical SAM protein [Clostridiales bacterium]|nr:radical SAM protein [Clostridiales bacterium]